MHFWYPSDVMNWRGILLTCYVWQKPGSSSRKITLVSSPSSYLNLNKSRNTSRGGGVAVVYRSDLLLSHRAAWGLDHLNVSHSLSHSKEKKQIKNIMLSLCTILLVLNLNFCVISDKRLVLNTYKIIDIWYLEFKIEHIAPHRTLQSLDRNYEGGGKRWEKE